MSESGADAFSNGHRPAGQGQRTLRLGLVGAGRIARVHARCLQMLGPGEAVVAAIADTDLAKARSMAEGIGCTGFASHCEMARHAELDAVVVCTPPHSHAEITRFFLDRHVAVLCEKPLCSDTATAASLIKYALQNSSILIPSAKFRYAADVNAALNVIQTGAIGRIEHVSIVFSSGLDVSGQWRLSKAISGGGVLMDKGPQAFDLLSCFLGPLAAVRAQDSGHEGAVEDYVKLSVRGRSGIRGVCELSWRFGSETRVYAEITGTEGEIELGWETARRRVRRDGPWIAIGTGYNQDQAFGAQLRNFLAVLRGGERLHAPLSDAGLCMAAIDAAYRSIETADWTPIHEGA